MVFSFSVASGGAYLSLSVGIKLYFLDFPYHRSRKTCGLIKLAVLILLHYSHDFCQRFFLAATSFPGGYNLSLLGRVSYL